MTTRMTAPSSTGKRRIMSSVSWLMFRAAATAALPITGSCHRWCTTFLTEHMIFVMARFAGMNGRSGHFLMIISVRDCAIITISVHHTGGQNEYNPTDHPGIFHGS